MCEQGIQGALLQFFQMPGKRLVEYTLMHLIKHDYGQIAVHGHLLYLLLPLVSHNSASLVTVW